LRAARGVGVSVEGSQACVCQLRGARRACVNCGGRDGGVSVERSALVSVPCGAGRPLLLLLLLLLLLCPLTHPEQLHEPAERREQRPQRAPERPLRCTPCQYA
jgi:hypothetical protein